MTHLLALALVLAAPVKAPAPATTATPALRPVTAPAAPSAPALPPASAAPKDSLVKAPPAAGARAWAIQAEKSKLAFHVDHKLHHVLGASKALDGKALLLPDGTLQLMVRAPISSFESGDANRDSHMREVLEASKFPFVTLKGVAKVAPPAAFPATVKTMVNAELDFHGVKLSENVPLTLEWRAPGEVRATGELTVSLERYRIERPSFLMMKLEDACKVEIDVTAREAAR